MNRREKEIYLELLRAALWEREVDISVFIGEWKWKVLLNAFRKHDLLGVVANVIILLPEKVKPSMQEMALVYNYLGSLIQSHRQLNRRLDDIMPRLKAVGCQPALLKGQGLSVLYPKTCVRACGDLDIYVGEDKLKDAIKVVNSMATPEELAHAKEHDTERHYQIVIDGIIYEIHPTVGEAGNGRYEKEFESVAKQYLDTLKYEVVSLPVSAEEKVDIEVLALEFNVWYVFNHLVDHLCDSGVGYRQFCDWMMVVRKFGIFRNSGSLEFWNSGSLEFGNSGIREGGNSGVRELGGAENPEIRKSRDPEIHLSQTLRKVGLLRAWKILGGILVYQLGLPKEEFPLFDERLAKKSQGFIVDDMLDGARFRFAPLEEMRDKQGHGIKHLLYNMHFYYYISRPQYVLSPLAPYITCAKYLFGGLKNSLKMLFTKKQ